MLERMMLLPFTRIPESLQRAEALAQSESTRDAMIQMQQSLFRLAAIEQILKLRVQWTPEQARRQQQRLVRQQARLQRQEALLEHLRDERDR